MAQWLRACLPAQGVIPGSWDRVLHRALHREPASPSAYVSASLCVSLMNKQIKSLKKKERERERKGGEKKLSGACFKDTNPFKGPTLRTSSNPDNLLQAPSPSITTVGGEGL